MFECPISFVEMLEDIFDKKLTTFNQIYCECSVRSSHFLSNIAKEVILRVKNDEY